MCPLRVHRLKPHPRGDGIRRWGLWEVIRRESRALESGIRGLKEETPIARGVQLSAL